MPEKGVYTKFKNFGRKIESPFMICADFKSILVPEDNGKQNPNESHVACSYGYKLVCVDDKFSKPFKSYLGKDAVYNFISSIIEESKYCSDVMKKHFNKKLVMTKKGNKDFENSTKSCISDNDFTNNGDVEVRDDCHITGKYRGSAHRDCNINTKLNKKIAVTFHNLKDYDSHLIMQELGKFNLKINVIPNGLEKYMSFSINNKLRFINSFQFLSSSLDSLVKNLRNDDL